MPTSGVDASSLRAWNERALLDALENSGPLRISDLAQQCQLTAPTVRGALNGLLEKGWVDELEPGAGSRGRPAATFQLRRHDYLVAGLDLGAHTVRACLVDAQQQVVATAERRVRPQTPDNDRLALVRESLAELSAGREVWAAGLALGGTILPDGEVAASIAMPRWQGLRPHEVVVPSELPVVTVVNDVRASLFAEATTGACAGATDVLLVQLGRRPTFTLSREGAVLEGAQGWAGEVTASTLLPRFADSQWHALHANDEDPAGAALVALARGSEADRTAALTFWRQFIPVVDFASCLVDPSDVVVAGLDPSLRADFLDELRTHVNAHVPGKPRVHGDSLGAHASAIGAALTAAQQIRQHLLPGSGQVLDHTKDEVASIRL